MPMGIEINRRPDPSSVLRNPIAVPSVPMMTGQQAMEAQQDRTMKLEDRQYERQQNEGNLKRDAYKAMLTNPEAAPAIAQAYGVDYTPEIDAVVKNSQARTRVLEGITYAEKMNIGNPQASMEFVKNYAKTGDLNSAIQSVAHLPNLQGYKSTNDRYKVVGGALIDTFTGQPVYERPRLPKTGKLEDDSRIPGNIRFKLADMNANPFNYTDQDRAQMEKLLEQYAPSTNNIDAGVVDLPVQQQGVGGGMGTSPAIPAIAPQSNNQAPADWPAGIPYVPTPPVPQGLPNSEDIKGTATEALQAELEQLKRMGYQGLGVE